MPERLHLTYEAYGALLEDLIRHLGDSYTHVFGPPRGGLPIAVHLSHHFELPLIHSESALAEIAKGHNAPHVLLVDDIADTGRSLERLLAILNKAGVAVTTAALYCKPRSVITPDIRLIEIPDHVWITFPWERSDEAPNRPLEPSTGHGT